MPIAPPRHNAHRVRQNRLAKNKDYNRLKRRGQEFYNSRAWKKLRDLFIRQNPLCKNCRGNGKTVEANVVDHVIPIEAGGACLNWDNLQSLCHLCHNQKSADDRKKYQID